MTDLQSTLTYVFEHPSSGSGGFYCQSANTKSKYMVININKELFEIPMFAMYAMSSEYNTQTGSTYDAIVVKLDYAGVRSYYKTVDAAVRNGIEGGYSSTRLHRLPLVDGKAYYITGGAIFDEDFHPMMLITWEIQRKPNDSSIQKYDYLFANPILRIRPDVVIHKRDALERYIVNKILPSTLDIHRVCSPCILNNSRFSLNDPLHSYKPKVIIEDIPFLVKSPDVPSISTTNKELLNVALDNLEDLV